ncbi:regulator of G-protein signaling 21-like [Protopterus annectens]|uniref:regulator of G-protein signaling 21-like n=1 Tax=Protopterus annectens TaxID=7888 RepID=UPI001CFB83F1|nr:regulator of G-protein signaling 21-like [Protopterus annectens]
MLLLNLIWQKKIIQEEVLDTEADKVPVDEPFVEAAAVNDNARNCTEDINTAIVCFKAGLEAFRSFLKSEFSEENIDFWLACEDFKKTKAPDIISSKAQQIYTDFIEVNAPKEINIDFNTRDTISKNISEPTINCFDNAQKSIYSLMVKDSFPRFLKSDVYQELMQKSQTKTPKKWFIF